MQGLFFCLVRISTRAWIYVGYCLFFMLLSPGIHKKKRQKNIDRTCRETERKRLTKTEKKTFNTRMKVTTTSVRVAIVAEQKQEVLHVHILSVCL